MSEDTQDEACKKNASVTHENASAECGTQSVDASTYVSQTILGQMTTSSNQTADSSAKWNCEVCTYENFPMSRKCTMCRSSKPLLNEDIFRLQDGASALPPSPDVCDADLVSERLRPLRISSPPEQASASSINKWSCVTCTYENWPKSLKCAMCGTSNPLPSSNQSAAESKRSNIGVNELSNNQSASKHDLDNNRRSKRRNNTDWVWLQACLGVVEGDESRVESYLSAGGDPARALAASEVAVLDRASAFGEGHTLVHLAIRFQRQEILTTLLSRISGGGPGLKRSPSYIAPDIATAIRRHISSSIRTKKGGFPCRYINEFCTFSLPSEIEDLPAPIQDQLFLELLDKEAQHTLEADPPVINWNIELTVTYGSRLYALWNRSAGDCLLDAVCQSAYGLGDRDNCLRTALADCLQHAHRSLYARWAWSERWQAAQLSYSPDESQLRAEWARCVQAARGPRTALQQLHVFVLAHVMRRPIIVYGVNVVNSFRGEALGYARFQGIYLPLLWEREACSTSPLCLGYTRGHFCALVPLEPYRRATYICREPQEENDEVYLPITDSEGKLLPVHFLNCEEMSDTESVVRRWLAVGDAERVARQIHTSRPLLVAQMVEEWLNHYRRLAQQTRGPFPPRLQTAEFSSDPDSDEE